ncbi:hypothetical protein HanRHA438_Chr06g0250721 [Helianthus annuus]|nr:hypothetical protein HanRHA438_Chr06g0250721 [Helianthus annuus]
MMVPQSSSTSPFCLNPSPLNQSKEVVMKNNKGALQEQALFEMLQALREAEMLNFIICLKYIIPQV